MFQTWIMGYLQFIFGINIMKNLWTFTLKVSVQVTVLWGILNWAITIPPGDGAGEGVGVSVG